MWVARFVLEDRFHERSYRWLFGLLGDGVQMAAPSTSLAEVAGAVARRQGSTALARQAIRLIRELPTMALHPIEEDLAVHAAELAADLRLRGGDALYVALAVRLGVPLVTWDQEQRERARPVAQTLTPAEAPPDGRRDGE